MRFNPATYSVIENRTSVTVTLEALAEHDHSFTVIVATRDGSAVGEWELLMDIRTVSCAYVCVYVVYVRTYKAVVWYVVLFVLCTLQALT